MADTGSEGDSGPLGGGGEGGGGGFVGPAATDAVGISQGSGVSPELGPGDLSKARDNQEGEDVAPTMTALNDELGGAGEVADTLPSEPAPTADPIPTTDRQPLVPPGAQPPNAATATENAAPPPLVTPPPPTAAGLDISGGAPTPTSGETTQGTESAPLSEADKKRKALLVRALMGAPGLKVATQLNREITAADVGPDKQTETSDYIAKASFQERKNSSTDTIDSWAEKMKCYVTGVGTDTITNYTRTLPPQEAAFFQKMGFDASFTPEKAKELYTKYFNPPPDNIVKGAKRFEDDIFAKFTENGTLNVTLLAKNETLIKKYVTMFGAKCAEVISLKIQAVAKVKDNPAALQALLAEMNATTTGKDYKNVDEITKHPQDPTYLAMNYVFENGTVMPVLPVATPEAATPTPTTTPTPDTTTDTPETAPSTPPPPVPNVEVSPRFWEKLRKLFEDTGINTKSADSPGAQKYRVGSTVPETLNLTAEQLRSLVLNKESLYLAAMDENGKVDHLYYNRAIVSYDYDLGADNARYVAAKKKNSFLTALAYTAADTKENQAKYFALLAKTILQVHKANKELIGQWITKQSTENGEYADGTKYRSVETLLLHDFKVDAEGKVLVDANGKPNKPKPEDERMIIEGNGTIIDVTALPARWETRVDALIDALKTGKELTNAQQEQLKFLSYSVNVGRLAEGIKDRTVFDTPVVLVPQHLVDQVIAEADATQPTETTPNATTTPTTTRTPTTTATETAARPTTPAAGTTATTATSSQREEQYNVPVLGLFRRLKDGFTGGIEEGIQRAKDKNKETQARLDEIDKLKKAQKQQARIEAEVLIKKAKEDAIAIMAAARNARTGAS